MSAQLRVVPALTQHQAHAASLTPEHTGRLVTLAAEDGSVVRGVLFSASPSLTTGLTVLSIRAIGTLVRIAVPDLAPIHVHPESPRRPR